MHSPRLLWQSEPSLYNTYKANAMAHFIDDISEFQSMGSKLI